MRRKKRCEEGETGTRIIETRHIKHLYTDFRPQVYIQTGSHRRVSRL
jgi:hypothetical protein